MLRKKNRIKTLAGTLEIEGSFLGEGKITVIVECEKVLGTVKEISKLRDWLLPMLMNGQVKVK